MLFSAAQIPFEVLILSKFVNICVVNFSAILLLQVISAKVKWKRGLIIPNCTCNNKNISYFICTYNIFDRSHLFFVKLQNFLRNKLPIFLVGFSHENKEKGSCKHGCSFLSA